MVRARQTHLVTATSIFMYAFTETPLALASFSSLAASGSVKRILNNFVSFFFELIIDNHYKLNAD